MIDSVPTPPPLLAARGLAFSRNDEPVFGPLEFAVNAGEALLVQGGNGAGKTTLLRVLAGLLRADRGDIEIDGRAANATQRSRAIAYLGHLPALKADLDTLENLNFLCGLHGRRARQMPGNALAMVGLAGYEDALARQLSAGAEEAAFAGAAVAVAGAAVAARRALRQSRPGGHQPGQPDDLRAPAQRRRRAGHHARRLRGATRARPGC